MRHIFKVAEQAPELTSGKTPGVCPKCNAPLEYEEGAWEAPDVKDSYAYSVDCQKCGWHGTEWYTLQFVEKTDEEGNTV